MRDRLVELLNEAHEGWLHYVDNCAFNQMALSFTFEQMFADHLLANGVIVPPCKPGELLWVICKGKGEEREVRPFSCEGMKYDDEKRICDSEILTFGECIMRVNNAPTVDIKTEVAREIFAEIAELERYLDYEDDYYCADFLNDLNKLKNKYTKE